MGNVLTPLIVPMVGLATQALSHVFRRPDRENPTLVDIRSRHRAVQARRAAEQTAEEAQELARRIQRQALRDREAAHARQEEVHRAAARATRELERMRAETEEAVEAARLAEERVQEVSEAVKEEAARLMEEAKEERERSQKVREELERATVAAREEVERAKKAAEEQYRETEVAEARAEEMSRSAAEEIRKANEAREVAEKCLREGIQPVVTPTLEELATAKRRIEYKEDCFHFAIAGISGSGKSSLVNAFRGLRNRDPGAAPVGVTETTLEMTRYPDTNPNNPYVWYDIPGAGTLKCRDWQYFNDQGLYVFDCIIVLFDNRFTMTDVAILVNARRFNIPTYIVRSKADQHIQNIMLDLGYNGDTDGDDVERRTSLYKTAREQLIETTRKSVKDNLAHADLADQRVYIVTNTALLSIVQNKVPKKMIDEMDLINDLLNEAYARRGVEPEVTYKN